MWLEKMEGLRADQCLCTALHAQLSADVIDVLLDGSCTQDQATASLAYCSTVIVTSPLNRKR